MASSQDGVSRLVETARSAREARRLGAALEALDRAFEALDRHDGRAAKALGEEAALVAKAVDARGAPLRALSECLRAFDAARVVAAREGIGRGARRYKDWRPRPVEAAAGSLFKAAATGAFLVGAGTHGRVVVLEGGINAETVAPARRALERSAAGVAWLLVDMKGLGYVGSTGLAAAVKVAEGLGKAGGGLVLFDVASALNVLVDTLGLGRYFTPVQGLEAALGKVHERRLAAAR